MEFVGLVREPTSFDVVAQGDTTRVAENSNNENLDAHKIYAQKPHDDSQARVETSLRSEICIDVTYLEQAKMKHYRQTFGALQQL